MAAHLARGKEQAELYHLHGRHDDVTHHEGETPVADEVTRETNELILALQALGLAGHPVLDQPPTIGGQPPGLDEAQVLRGKATEGNDEQ